MWPSMNPNLPLQASINLYSPWGEFLVMMNCGLLVRVTVLSNMYFIASLDALMKTLTCIFGVRVYRNLMHLPQHVVTLVRPAFTFLSARIYPLEQEAMTLRM